MIPDYTECLAKESGHNISYNITFALSKDSDRSVHPHKLIRVFAVRLKTVWIIGYVKNVLRKSDQAAQM